VNGVNEKETNTEGSGAKQGRKKATAKINIKFDSKSYAGHSSGFASFRKGIQAKPTILMAFQRNLLPVRAKSPFSPSFVTGYLAAKISVDGNSQF
jgi:hypothetical protein